MKTLKTIHLVGSRQCKATNWMFEPGFTQAEFTDGVRLYMGDINFNEAFARLKSMRDVDTVEFEYRQAKFEKEHSYPPKPENAVEFYHGYGYEKPVQFHKWQWSTTFGQWSALVTFEDGWHGYAYPKPQ